MKRTISTVCFVLAALAAAAQTTGAGGAVKAPSKLESATVFNRGAELIHSARVPLRSGTNEVTIEGLSSSIDENSLTIKCSDNVTVLSSRFVRDYTEPRARTAEAQRLRDSVVLLDGRLREIGIRMKAARGMLRVLDVNTTQEKTVADATALSQLMDYYRSKFVEINKQLAEFHRDSVVARLDLSGYNNQLKQEEEQLRRPTGTLRLQLAAPLTRACDIEVGYFTDNSSWQPVYDIRATGPDRPLTVVSKATFRQSTGLDWSGVRITLSTATPSTGRTAPVLGIWFVGNKPAGRPTGTIRSLSIDDSAPAESVLYGQMMGVDILSMSGDPGGYQRPRRTPDPVFVVDGAVVDAATANSIAAGMVASREFVSGARAQQIYGSVAEGGATVITTRRDFITEGSTASAEATYTIDMPAELIASGSEHTVTLRTIEIPARFEYYVVPAVDKAVYLMASITDWAQYGLLAGQATVTNDGTYAGKTTINPYSTDPTLRLTLGQDRGVVVTREKLQDFSRVRTIGSDKRQSVGYRITVRNTKNVPVNIVLRERYPVSASSAITVTLDRTDGAENDPEVGTLTWGFDLKPDEGRTFEAGYTVTSPKDFVLDL